MEKAMLFILSLFLTTLGVTQRSSKTLQKLSINYSYSLIINGNDTVKMKRTPYIEWNKLSSIDQDLLTHVLNVENYLLQRKSGLHSASYYNSSNEIEVYFDKLKECAQKNKIELDLTDYENELAFHKRHPKADGKNIEIEIKSYRPPAITEEEKRREKIQKYFDESTEARKKEEQIKQEGLEYNRKIGIRNDSIEAANKRQKIIKDSLQEISYQQEVKKQKAADSLEEKSTIERNRKAKIANEEKAKQRRIKLIEKYGSVKGEMIYNHKVEIGWTKAMCIDSWGKPIDINRTTVASGVHEQYVYSLKKYLYFENGILTAIQD